MSLEVFISYSHKDKMFRNELGNHLSNLISQQIISSWHDGNIVPGTEWQPQVMQHLKTAHIILLLISSDFMASDFCYSIEMETAIARHRANEVRVIPIILRPTDWKGATFANLQILPEEGRPITSWANLDDAFKNVIDGIRIAIDDLNKNGTTINP